MLEPACEAEAVCLGRLDEILAVQGLVTAGHAAVVIEFLPLAHHAVAKIVQYDDLDGQFVCGCGFEFTNIHSDAGIAVDVDDNAPGLCELCANRGRQAEAHCAHAA
jgi:hypothetical protein